MTNRQGRLLPTARDVAWMERRIERERRRAAGEAPRRPPGGPVVHGDDVGPERRPPGRPRSPESVGGRIAALAVGQGFEAGPGARSNAFKLAARAGVRVRVVIQPGGRVWVERISDDSPRGRWPDLAGQDDEKTPV